MQKLNLQLAIGLARHCLTPLSERQHQCFSTCISIILYTSKILIHWKWNAFIALLKVYKQSHFFLFQFLLWYFFYCILFMLDGRRHIGFFFFVVLAHTFLGSCDSLQYYTSSAIPCFIHWRLCLLNGFDKLFSQLTFFLFQNPVLIQVGSFQHWRISRWRWCFSMKRISLWNNKDGTQCRN